MRPFAAGWFCGLTAFFAETLQYTRGYDTHEIGIDEYIALCRELGAEPFITVNAGLETASDAADWVQYCNGSTRTRWGKVRARRGHPKPYNVKYWSLGNEMGYGHMKGANSCEEYCKIAHDFAGAMRQADPSITLVGSGTWFQGWVKRVPRKSYYDYEHVSFHWYVMPAVNDLLGKNAKKDLSRLAKMPDTDRARLQELRDSLDAHAPAGRAVGIAYDEWNVWHCWHRRPLVVDAIYAAGVLHMLCRNATALGISMAAFFEPVNEGAILVDHDGCELTTIGEAFAMLKAHVGGRLLEVPYSAGKDVDALATINPNGDSLYITLVNRNPDKARRIVLDLGAATRRHSRGRFIQLNPAPAAGCAVRFARQDRPLAIPSEGSPTLELPPFSISGIELPLTGFAGE